MTLITEAVYTNGVLKPLGELELREAQRVRLIVQPIEHIGGAERTAALKRLLTGIQSMEFNYGGRSPARDELHDRT